MINKDGASRKRVDGTENNMYSYIQILMIASQRTTRHLEKCKKTSSFLVHPDRNTIAMGIGLTSESIASGQVIRGPVISEYCVWRDPFRLSVSSFLDHMVSRRFLDLITAE